MPVPDPKVTRYESSFGGEPMYVTVETPFKNGETEVQWQARHDANVAAMKVEFPEV